MDAMVGLGIVIVGVGVILVMQGFIGKDPPSEGWLPWLDFRPDSKNPGMTHPPERHPVRLALIGLGVILAGGVWIGAFA